jgi:hypothetical protein
MITKTKNVLLIAIEANFIMSIFFSVNFNCKRLALN